MEALDVQIYLRRCGVVVHHAARMPPTADGRQSVVVFLESALGQFDLARRCALRLPGVVDVSFSGFSRSIMYVIGAEQSGRSARARRPNTPDSDPYGVRAALVRGTSHAGGLRARAPTAVHAATRG